MEYFVRHNGKTLGPLMLFQLREMLEEKSVAPTDFGWHEGMKEWLPLHEIEALAAIVQPKPPPLPEDFVAQAEMERFRELQAEAESRTGEGFRRFFARLFDLGWFGLLLQSIAVALGWQTLGEIAIPHVIVVLAIPLLWIFAESLFLSRLGTTPGKWLLGIRVRDLGGGLLRYRQALIRSFDVWFFGMGTGFQCLQPLCMVFGYVRLKQTGITHWDEVAASKIERRPLTIQWPIVMTVLVVAYWIFNFWLILSQPIPDHAPKELRTMIQEFKAGRILDELLKAAPTQ